MQRKLCVVGLGYIGLPTSAVFASNGWQVTGVDINEQVVASLNNGAVTIKEKGLDELVGEVIRAGSFKARVTPEAADVFIIAVPTPHNSDQTANLTNVKQAVDLLLPVLKRGNTIIIESTVPPRTTRDVIAPILERAGFVPGEDVYLAYCPERVLPGKILVELVENNRIIGGVNEQSAQRAADVYRSFVVGKVTETTAENAEMSKLMENTYRDVNIALANELAKVSAELKVDALEVIELANEHPRVNLHQPGPGVGGHCIAVDPYFIIEKDRRNTQIMQRARAVNESMPLFVVEQVEKIVSRPAKVALFGLAFKGNVADIRNSPALDVRAELVRIGYDVACFDPYVTEEQVDFPLATFDGAIENAEVLVVLTEHTSFGELDWEKVQRSMKRVNVIDTRNCLKNVPDRVNYYTYRNLYKLARVKQSASGSSE